MAHQLEVTVQEIEQFKRQNDLLADGSQAEGGAHAFPDEIDLRAEDDELIAAELEAAAEQAKAQAEAAETTEAEPDTSARRRRRPRRGRRSSSRAPEQLEGTFDHGEEGYGLWLDPAIQENPTYAEHWAGHRPVYVIVEEDQIVIRRAAEEDDG